MYGHSKEKFVDQWESTGDGRTNRREEVRSSVLCHGGRPRWMTLGALSTSTASSRDSTHAPRTDVYRVTSEARKGKNFELGKEEVLRLGGPTEPVCDRHVRTESMKWRDPEPNE